MKKIIITMICIISTLLVFTACGGNDDSGLTLDEAIKKATSQEAKSKVKNGSITITEKIAGSETKKEITYEFSAGGDYVHIVEKANGNTDEAWYSLADEYTVLGIQMYYGQPTVIEDAQPKNVNGYHFSDKFFTAGAIVPAYGVEEMVKNVYEKIAYQSHLAPIDGLYEFGWSGQLDSKESTADFSLKLDDNYTIVDFHLLVTDVASGDSIAYNIKQTTGTPDATETNSVKTLCAENFSLTLVHPDGSKQELKDGDIINISPLNDPDEVLLFEFGNITPDTALMSIDEPQIRVTLAGADTGLLSVTYDAWEGFGQIYAQEEDSVNKNGESYTVNIQTLRKTFTFNVIVGRPELSEFKPAVSYFNGFADAVKVCDEYTLYNTLDMSFGANVNDFADGAYTYIIKNSAGEKISEGTADSGIFTDFSPEENGKYTIELTSTVNTEYKATLTVKVVDAPTEDVVKNGKYCTTAQIADGDVIKNVKVIVEYSGDKITLTVGDKVFTEIVSRSDDKFHILSDKDDTYRIYSPTDKYYQLFFSYKTSWEDTPAEVFSELLPATPENLLAGDIDWIDFSNSWENWGTTVYGFLITFSGDGTGSHESNYQDDCEWFYSDFDWTMDENGNISITLTETAFSDIKNISGKFVGDYSTLEITATYNDGSVKTMKLKMSL